MQPLKDTHFFLSATSSPQQDVAIRVASSATVRLVKNKEAQLLGVGETQGDETALLSQNLTSNSNDTHAAGEIDFPDVEGQMGHLEDVPKEGSGPPAWFSVTLGFLFTGLSVACCFGLNFWWNRRPWAW